MIADKDPAIFGSTHRTLTLFQPTSTSKVSHGGEWEEKAPNAGDCPRCSMRNSWEVIGELIQTFRDGVRSVGSATDVIAWDWGWGDELAAKLIPMLPRDVALLRVSESEIWIGLGDLVQDTQRHLYARGGALDGNHWYRDGP